jgi:transcriptional regulator GlxA family with amidase domain
MRIPSPKLAAWGGVALLLVVAAAFGGWLYSLPPATSPVAPPPIGNREMTATLAALQPPKRERPLITIVGINAATETTDYLVPYGILQRAGIADVMMLSTEPGPVTLYPALTVEADSTIAEFDTHYPEGADYVIVPAMSRDDDPAVLAWLKSQVDGGATVVGICAGAKVVAAAGLLDGKRATTHWYFLEELGNDHPSVIYVPDRRLVVDQSIATTTGVTASMPMMLTLIEAIAGRSKAELVARDLGLAQWDANHFSDAFKLTRPFASTVFRNVLAFWNREQFGIKLAPGIDEVSLALVADAWSRTYRSTTLTLASTADPVVTRNGVRVLPDKMAQDSPAPQLVPAFAHLKPANALEHALLEISDRYGDSTANVVAMQLEYSRQ